MKSLLIGCLTLLVICCGIAFLPPTAATVDRAKEYFNPHQIERGWEYSLESRILAWTSVAVHLAWILVLVFTPLGRRLADGCLRVFAGKWFPEVLSVGLIYWLGDKLLSIPFIIAHWLLQTHWGLTQQSLTDRLLDLHIAWPLDLVMSAMMLAGLYLLLQWFPRRWWLVAWLVVTPLGILYVYLLPVAIEPLFNTFTPLSQTPWKGQEPNLRALVAKGGVEVGDILVMDASRRSTHTNAYFTGFGSTQRIVLFDNLLKQHNPPEVESIVAHELGHWLHHHIVKGMILGSLGVLLGLLAMSRILIWALGRSPLELRSISDPAGVPFFVLLVWIGSWLARPLENGVSRYFERQADEMSLKLAGRPHVFKEAEKRLALDNLSNLAPHPLTVWMYYSHPPAVERIRMAEEWMKKSPP